MSVIGLCALKAMRRNNSYVRSEIRTDLVTLFLFMLQSYHQSHSSNCGGVDKSRRPQIARDRISLGRSTTLLRFSVERPCTGAGAQGVDYKKQSIIYARVFTTSWCKNHPRLSLQAIRASNIRACSARRRNPHGLVGSHYPPVLR
jgi:hypothetical protein